MLGGWDAWEQLPGSVWMAGPVLHTAQQWLCLWVLGSKYLACHPVELRQIFDKLHCSLVVPPRHYLCVLFFGKVEKTAFLSLASAYGWYKNIWVLLRLSCPLENMSIRLTLARCLHAQGTKWWLGMRNWDAGKDGAREGMRRPCIVPGGYAQVHNSHALSNKNWWVDRQNGFRHAPCVHSSALRTHETLWCCWCKIGSKHCLVWICPRAPHGEVTPYGCWSSCACFLNFIPSSSESHTPLPTSFPSSFLESCHPALSRFRIHVSDPWSVLS